MRPLRTEEFAQGMKATQEEIRAFVNDRPHWLPEYSMGELEMIQSSREFAAWRLDRALRELGREIVKAMPTWLRRWSRVE